MNECKKGMSVAQEKSLDFLSNFLVLLQKAYSQQIENLREEIGRV
jgi:hypothetical protein